MQNLQGIIGNEYSGYLQKCPHTSLLAYLKKYLCKKLQDFDLEVINTCIKALLCEPTNLFGGTSHIAPPDMNSYIKKYEFIDPMTYEFIYRMNS